MIDALPTTAEVDALRAALTAADYRPVPVQTRDKRPHGFAWQVRARKGEVPAATGATLSTGVMCDGLRVIDIDIDDDATATSVADLVRHRLGTAPERYRENSNRRTLVYRAAEGEPPKQVIVSATLTNIDGKPARVEVLGYGQQFVAFGIHPSGAELRWRDEPLHEVPRFDLTAISEDQVTALLAEIGPMIGTAALAAPPRLAPPPAMRVHASGDDDLAEMEELLGYLSADCNYEDWVRVLMAIHEETAGSAAGLALADQWSARGGKAYAGYAAIERKWRSFHTSGGITGATIAGMAEDAGADLSEIARRHHPEDYPTYDEAEAKQVADRLFQGFQQRRAEIVANELVQETINPETGEFEERSSDEPPGLYDGTDWMHPDGLLGEIAEWIMATARRPNRPMAVAAAVSILGAVCGRHLSTPTRADTHLYIAIVGDTAVGKDRCLRAISVILDAAKIPIATTGKFKSDIAIEEMVKSKPCILAVADELGQNLFARIGRRNGSAHEDAISSVLRELWGVNFAPYDTSQGAVRSTMRIYSPSFSLFGGSTTDEFYASLANEAVTNGFLNRFLIVKAAPRQKPVNIETDPRDVPQVILNGLWALLPPPRQQSTSRGVNMNADPLSALIVNNDCPTQLVPWASSEVQAAFGAYEEKLLEVADDWKELAPFIGRTAEMSIRLATVHALSRDARYASVTMDDLAWGRALATASADGMFRDARDRLAENESQRNYNRIRAIIREAGKDGMTNRELMRKLHGTIVGRAYDDAIRALVDGGEIREQTGGGSSRGGRPSRRYTIAR